MNPLYFDDADQETPRGQGQNKEGSLTDVHTPKSQPESVAGEDEAATSFGGSQATAADSGTGGTSQPPAANAGWLRWGWRQLTSMRTALILLFLLALGSIPGSVLPQQGSDAGAVQQYYT